jgi:hypothetical protein
MVTTSTTWLNIEQLHSVFVCVWVPKNSKHCLTQH